MSDLTGPPRRRSVREIESLEAFLEHGAGLREVAVQGVDLTEAQVDWDSVDVHSTLFLGCRFPSDDIKARLERRGALVFPQLAARPYDPYRRTLYTPAELTERCPWAGVWNARDRHIHEWYVNAGRHLPDVGEALAQRLHDFAIDDALGDLIGESTDARLKRRIVGIMGGHSRRRDSEAYARAARVGWLLGRDHLVVTGGGPGIMEAGNLGAYLSDRSESALEEAVAILRRSPSPEAPGYQEAAAEVRTLFPEGGASLAVPTWFYGFEPINLFGSEIAKYFSNSIREDGLLAICLHGIVFAEGSAGTVQEVFMDAAQNHYATFDHRSPMAFLGRERYEPSNGFGVYPTLVAEASDYADLLTLSDSPEEIAAFIRESAPDGPGG